MTTTVIGLFDRYADAQAAVYELEAAHIATGDISIVANSGDDDHNAAASKDAGAGAGVGAVVGGVGGLLAGLGVMAIPGVGPVVAAGWLVATATGALAGAAVGGAAGGIIGSLMEEGVSEDDAHVYAEGVKRGGALVTARVDDASAAHARVIIDRNKTVDIAQRRADYRDTGWSKFDAGEPFASVEEIEARRLGPEL